MSDSPDYDDYGPADDSGAPDEVLASFSGPMPDLLDLSDQPRAMSLDVDELGGYAVPYQLDDKKPKKPTITT